ncbi:short-chain dehydrogenase/reductase SDR [Fibrella aestuarina BUZ 2]|uniref:Short-chain dehydrogenase/reductase SDR n=1 Tax=Fibrella aestuarina BUZ 2 TaxID=1166018 RepID=I0KD68_9BACT|nr:SDR family oxidoreductase [Fibrella aestuarina]CCH02071.1 short-chain dehydrogenase/reductase SDR [Fibrella aestuarina BUZ 2]
MTTNRLCVITGANSGIGKITAQELARKGFDIVMLCRNLDKARPVQQAIQAANPTVTIDLIQCDVASMASVRAAAAQVQDRYDHIDVLVNNAGLYITNEQYSPDGYELTFATNHLGAFLLTNLLLDLLRKGQDARVVTVSSEAHRLAGTFRLDELARPTSYGAMKAYGKSKLCNILFAKELADRLMDDGITSNSLHPGTVSTNFAADSGAVFGAILSLARPFLKTPEQGAATSIFLAASPQVEHVTGLYFDDSKPKTPTKDAQNNFYAKRLWELSTELVGL